MSRMYIQNTDMGRGRSNDSSSSRESSPERSHKRSFSPTSDDGDLVVPPIPFDDTPPPPERPLLRQPVGFAWLSSISGSEESPTLSTYQATPPNPNTSSAAFFLPGQEVPLPPALPKKKSGNSRVSKKRRSNAYAEQTGRFRLQTYDPLPIVEPPIQQGDGPYSSVFRGTSANVNAVASPSPTLTSSYDDDGSSTVFQSPTPEHGRHTLSSIKRSRQTTSRGKPSTARAKQKATPAIGHPSAQGKTLALPSSRRQNASGYYRRDYDTDVTIHEPETPHPSSSAVYRRSSESDSDIHRIYPSNAPSNILPPTLSNDKSSGGAEPGNLKRPQRPLRMVTLLIQDIRSGVVDRQLVEVKIPIKPAEDPTDGFWADAKLISEQLQAGPSRIDGPAKVYTLRGKYRQFFLRVSADNVDEIISTNIVIKPERILDVVVEALLPPGNLPLPPHIPQDLRSPTPESLSPSPFPERAENPRRRRDKESSSRESRQSDSPLVDSPDWRASSHSNHSPHVASIANKNSHGSSAGDRSTPAVSIPGFRHESPYSEDEPEEVHRIVVSCVDRIIQQDPEWTEFFRAKASVTPQRVSDVLKQYRLLKRMTDRWVGRKLAFRTSNHVIETSHITEALKIEDHSFSVACEETLALLELYGPNGKHFEDPRIVAMIEDTSRPEPNSKPIKRMLHLMRELDKQWRREQDKEARVRV